MAPPRPPCGSPHGARAHTRRGEPVCTPCRDASRAWWRDYSAGLRRITQPGRELVDNTDAHQAVVDAVNRGCQLTHIAAEAGINKTTIRHIYERRARRSQQRTVDRIVDACTRIRPQPPAGYRPVQPSQIRLRALKDGGASHRWLAEQLDTSQSQIHRIVHGRYQLVTADTEQRIQQLAAAIANGDIRPPGYAARYAIRRCRNATCDGLAPEGEGRLCRRCRKQRERRRRAA